MRPDYALASPRPWVVTRLTSVCVCKHARSPAFDPQRHSGKENASLLYSHMCYFFPQKYMFCNLDYSIDSFRVIISSMPLSAATTPIRFPVLLFIFIFFCLSFFSISNFLSSLLSFLSFLSLLFSSLSFFSFLFALLFYSKLFSLFFVPPNS